MGHLRLVLVPIVPHKSHIFFDPHPSPNCIQSTFTIPTSRLNSLWERKDSSNTFTVNSVTHPGRSASPWHAAHTPSDVGSGSHTSCTGRSFRFRSCTNSFRELETGCPPLNSLAWCPWCRTWPQRTDCTSSSHSLRSRRPLSRGQDWRGIGDEMSWWRWRGFVAGMDFVNQGVLSCAKPDF